MIDNIHSQTSFSELWACLPNNRNLAHTVYHKITSSNHWSHTNTTLHMLRERLNFTQMTPSSSLALKAG